MVEEFVIEEKITLKEFMQELRQSYKYVRLFQFKNFLKLENHVLEFKRIVLVSNELEECINLEIEKDYLKIQMKRNDIEILFIRFISIVNIPLFLIDKKRVDTNG